MKKEFLIKKPTDIPQLKETNLKISEWFLAKGLTIEGKEKVVITCYDFRKEKWIFTAYGVVKLIEYYIEV